MWFKIEKQQLKVYIYAKPNAKKTSVVSATENELHIALHAKPHQGEANKELITYIAKLFHVPKSQVIIQRGEESRHKVIAMPVTKDMNHVISIIQELVE